jgi:aryl-alcohol dehydrogenase-like predicted oxidoreductase
MIKLDDYVLDTLMRDLVGHDRRSASFLVYLWLAAEQQRRKSAVSISYSDLAESVGVSKSSAQVAIAWLIHRKLVSSTKANVTATPSYSVQTPWRADHRHKISHAAS